jgi:GntR family transcriptional regulator
MRAFQERGLIVRVQGVGTYVGPKRIEAGLEELVSLETLASRAGLTIGMEGLSIVRRPPDEAEAAAFGLPPDGWVVEIARRMLAEGRPIAYLIDVLPEGVIPEEALGGGFRGSVLDVLLERGEPPLGYSRTDIGAVAAVPDLAARMKVPAGEVLLVFKAELFTREAAIIDRSVSYFLPGTIHVHVVRTIGVPAGLNQEPLAQEALRR